LYLKLQNIKKLEKKRKNREAADKAREEFSSANTAITTLELKINNLEKLLSLDLGPEKQYYPLYDKCFNLRVEQYNYEFCPFKSVKQGYTNLGTWGSWENNYETMFYNNGEKCWNGPERSAKIVFECGADNNLYEASEPSKCEYLFKFTTPYVCNKARLAVIEELLKADYILV